MKQILKDKSSIRLSQNLSSRRQEFVSSLAEGYAILKKFAKNNNLAHLLLEDFCDSWEIFENKADFDNRIRELFSLDEKTQIPATYSAFLENKILCTVTPEIYYSNYPQGIEQNAFAKLICHEMAHRLHIRILNGNEEAMGPVWFYEGFALFVADQFVNDFRPLSHEELKSILELEKRSDYRRYAHAFRQLAAKAGSIHDFLTWPAKTDFNKRIQTLIIAK